MAFGCALHIQRLALFIEQLACKRTSRRFGLAPLAPADRPVAQPILNPLPQFAADDGFVLPRVAFILVADLARVDWVGQQMVERSAQKRLPAALLAAL